MHRILRFPAIPDVVEGVFFFYLTFFLSSSAAKRRLHAIPSPAITTMILLYYIYYICPPDRENSLRRRKTTAASSIIFLYRIFFSFFTKIQHQITEKSTELLYDIDAFLSKSNIKSSHFSFRFSFHRSLLHYVFLRKVTGTKVQRATCKSLQDDQCKYS